MINIHILWIYWVYNLTRAVFSSKIERLFKKNMYNSIIQSIAHLKLWLFPIFLAICGFHPKRTAPAWRPRMNQANFWYPVLMWTVFQWGRSASIGINGSRTGKGLGYNTGGIWLAIRRSPYNFWPVESDMAEYCRHGKLAILAWSHILAVFHSNFDSFWSIVVGSVHQ